MKAIKSWRFLDEKRLKRTCALRFNKFAKNKTKNLKAISMGCRKQGISKTIKSDFQIRFPPQDISAHSGLELERIAHKVLS